MISADIRRRLADLCANERKRRVAENYPCDWAPSKIINPDTDWPFTSFSAWDFIAAKLNDGTKVTAVTMDVPPGAIGYQMVVTMRDGRDLYMKIMLSHDGQMVLGRSFHNSVFTGK